MSGPYEMNLVMKKFCFDAIIQKDSEINAAFIEFPFNVETAFGKNGRVKVLFDEFEYRGSLVRMGHPCHIIGLNKKVREAISKGPNDVVHVVVIEDIEDRLVEIPIDFDNAMSMHAGTKEIFHSLSFTHRKEYVEWINAAKKQQTRSSRIERCIDGLVNTTKSPLKKAK